MTHRRHSFKGGATFLALLVCSAPVYATTQCPPEFGPKSPWVDVVGWLVVALGVVLGVCFAAYLIRRSRQSKWLARLVAVIVALAGMLFFWIGGFLLAIASFFMRC